MTSPKDPKQCTCPNYRQFADGANGSLTCPVHGVIAMLGLTPPISSSSQYICNGAHCKCMNLDGTCKNYHNGDHTCPSSSRLGDEDRPLLIEPLQPYCDDGKGGKWWGEDGPSRIEAKLNEVIAVLNNAAEAPRGITEQSEVAEHKGDAAKCTLCNLELETHIKTPGFPHTFQPPLDSEGELDINENTSDGYHTFKELYEFRLLYNAALFNEWANLPNNPYDVHKSHTHSDGEPAFGGGWFVVVAELPTGQITNHYEDKYWGLFRVPVTTMANEWDGHSPSDVAERLRSMIEHTSDAVDSGDDAKSEQHRTKQ